jgi:hypothetical protein
MWHPPWLYQAPSRLSLESLLADPWKQTSEHPREASNDPRTEGKLNAKGRGTTETFSGIPVHYNPAMYPRTLIFDAEYQE